MERKWLVRSNDNSVDKTFYFINGAKNWKTGEINKRKLVIFRTGCRNENVNYNELKTW